MPLKATDMEHCPVSNYFMIKGITWENREQWVFVIQCWNLGDEITHFESVLFRHFCVQDILRGSYGGNYYVK